MNNEKEKLEKAKEILRKMAGGINPLNGEQIEENSFLHDARMIRCLHFIQEVLQTAIEGQLRTSSKRPADFIITEEQKAVIDLPQGRIGVNVFAKNVNKVLDLNNSKMLTGVEINKRLKKMGILAEEPTEEGKTRTVLTAISGNYGIECEPRNYNGRDFEMILFNDDGKKFLLENLEKIMQITP